jgi:hypothetical protein
MPFVWGPQQRTPTSKYLQVPPSTLYSGLRTQEQVDAAERHERTEGRTGRGVVVLWPLDRRSKTVIQQVRPPRRLPGERQGGIMPLQERNGIPTHHVPRGTLHDLNCWHGAGAERLGPQSVPRVASEGGQLPEGACGHSSIKAGVAVRHHKSNLCLSRRQAAQGAQHRWEALYGMSKPSY